MGNIEIDSDNASENQNIRTKIIHFEENHPVLDFVMETQSEEVEFITEGVLSDISQIEQKFQDEIDSFKIEENKKEIKKDELMALLDAIPNAKEISGSRRQEQHSSTIGVHLEKKEN